jgi:hypothetical protein
MDNIGRAFGFYLHYWQQMEALYRDHKSGLPKTIENQEIKEMIKKVGERADEQARIFMNRCGQHIADCLDSKHHFCRAEPRKRRASTYWGVEVRLWPNNGRRSGGGRRWAGLTIEGFNGRPSSLLWLWTRGGRDAEDELARILGNRAKYRSADLQGWDSGAVIIDEIALDGDNFGFDGSKVFSRIDTVLSTFNRRVFRKIFDI